MRGISRTSNAMAPLGRRCTFHRTVPVGMPRRRDFFTSNLRLHSDEGDSEGGGRKSAAVGNDRRESKEDKTARSAQSVKATTPSAVALQAAKRKPRSAGAKNSLRRVAVIAQQQPSGASAAPKGIRSDETRAVVDRDTKADEAVASRVSKPPEEPEDGSNTISAVCLAESFDMGKVMSILEHQGYQIDPDGSGFESHEVVHARQWWPTAEDGHEEEWRQVDLFVFESGTLVGWGLAADAVDALATAHLVAAAADPFVALRETETLDFRRDAARDNSAMRGDVVVLGTRHEATEGDRLATTRAQIAFSSGLARSTKLAVLERSFTEYFESTRRIPEILAGRKSGGRDGGGLGHISQKFILQKTGELLSLRAQLNHYRELTDALPDIFWDARAELGLEGYYEQVGRALDVGVRIKTLNQKMDYAQEIATVLREISSERHGTRLEWIIIVLIAVEVVFELRRVYLDLKEGGEEKKEAMK
ncbi:uncharacterized protein SPSK_00524 [Sporothrix schenckii 1099-18]|uniref:DUF155 domain-containing protein n=2 Tax=Sporothrix schenckii TaxID=29908 RepID=U7Q691_SPOS1|nr:uncharacterized protein SPSK_00524 [Sporothrix schenckii 1099-18]ERT02712.1 hypothetical protein HMPREF1624_01013 [Sporothrix schenckii ATCC 58251]KJR79976.1 hypothetical protein SPSK_00524 [Sporothrix schenckii 1099-18]